MRAFFVLMSSTYGARRGVPEYDRFRTGLTFREVSRMMRVASDDPADWQHKRRRTVLGYWHALKLQLWEAWEREREAIEAINARHHDSPGSNGAE